MMARFLTLLTVTFLPDVALACTGSPVHTCVPARTTLTLQEPIPGYVFFAASLFDDGYTVKLFFENGRTAQVPHLDDRMLLIAVPEAIAASIPTDRIWKELRDNQPDGLFTHHYDSFFFEFIFTSHRDDRLEFVVRKGTDGIEFEELRRPRSWLAGWVPLLALGWTVLAFNFGYRWAERRRKRAGPD